MKKVIFSTLMFFIVICNIQSQILAKQQNLPGEILQRYTYKNTRVTVFDRGIIAGDLRTGKVIWRIGFEPDPQHRILKDSVQFAKGFFVYRYDWGPYVGSYFVDIEAGRSILEATSIFFTDEDEIYLRNYDQFNQAALYIRNVEIIQFNWKTKNVNKVIFSLFDLVDYKCFGKFDNGINLKFDKREKDNWFFYYQTEKCFIELNFDYSNTKRYVIKVTKGIKK